MQPSPSRSQDSTGFSGRSSSVESSALPACNLFNTTFSLYRASALFVGADGLSDARLRSLEVRLRDILTGDLVRGVEVGLDEDGGHALGNSGALEAVAIEWVSAEQAVEASMPALQVTLQYENAQCLAILLPVPDAFESINGTSPVPDDNFLRLPLLLLRMPTPLKDAITGFLSNSFDCRISPLQLGDKDVIRGWESWARATMLPAGGSLAKDAIFTLAFKLPELNEVDFAAEDADVADLPSPVSPDPAEAIDDASPSISDFSDAGLKAVDIFIPNDELRGFFEAGLQLQRTSEERNTPFTSALALYVKKHLGLDMAHPAASVVRIACGGFVLSNSRLKIFEPPGSRSGISLGQHGGIVPLILGDLVRRAGG